MKKVTTNINTPVLRKILKDLAATKNPKGGAAQPGTVLSSAGKAGEKSCGADGKSCSGKLGI